MHHYSPACKCIVLAALASASLLSTSAHAERILTVCATSELCGHIQPVNETSLASVAGKYTIAGEVVGMNLVMASSWQAGNGQNLESKAMLSIALPNSGHAYAHYGTQASATDPQDMTNMAGNPSGTVSAGSGTSTINGVSQLIQVAGDGNGAANRAQVNVTTAPLDAISGNGQLSTSYQAANGAQASAAIAGHGISLQLTMPGAGMAQQLVNATHPGNIQQNIQFAGNSQQVMNQLQMQLQIQPPSSTMLASNGVSQALDMLRGK